MSALPVVPLPGEIWWVDLGEGLPGEPDGDWPVVVVAPSLEDIREMPVVTVVPLTHTRRPYSFRVDVPSTFDSGLDRLSFAQVELVRTVSKDRFKGLLGYLESETWNAVKSALTEYFDV